MYTFLGKKVSICVAYFINFVTVRPCDNIIFKKVLVSICFYWQGTKQCFPELFTCVFFIGFGDRQSTWSPLTWLAEPLSCAFTWAVWDKARFWSQLTLLHRKSYTQWRVPIALDRDLLVFLYACWQILYVCCLLLLKMTFKQSCFNGTIQPLQLLMYAKFLRPTCLFIVLFSLFCKKIPLTSQASINQIVSVQWESC